MLVFQRFCWLKENHPKKISGTSAKQGDLPFQLQGTLQPEERKTYNVNYLLRDISSTCTESTLLHITLLLAALFQRKKTGELMWTLGKTLIPEEGKTYSLIFRGISHPHVQKVHNCTSFYHSPVNFKESKVESRFKLLERLLP